MPTWCRRRATRSVTGRAPQASTSGREGLRHPCRGAASTRAAHPVSSSELPDGLSLSRDLGGVRSLVFARAGLSGLGPALAVRSPSQLVRRRRIGLLRCERRRTIGRYGRERGEGWHASIKQWVRPRPCASRSRMIPSCARAGPLRVRSVTAADAVNDTAPWRNHSSAMNWRYNSSPRGRSADTTGVIYTCSAIDHGVRRTHGHHQTTPADQRRQSRPSERQTNFFPHDPLSSNTAIN